MKTGIDFINIIDSYFDKKSMIELFKKKKISPKLTKDQKKQLLLNHFCENENHSWVKQNRMFTRGTYMLVDSMTEKHLDFFLKNKTYFIPCQAHLSCAIGQTGNDHLILIFPEIFQILKSAHSLKAMAIMAHELGHIYYQHTLNKTNALVAQIEADRFAYELGFGEELLEVLLDFQHLEECRVRLQKLNELLRL